MEKQNIIQDAFIYPDFGIFYAKNFGSETKYFSNPHSLYNIARVNETLYTSTSNIEYDGQYYCMSLDYKANLFRQILKEINDQKLLAMFKNKLTGKFDSPEYVVFKETPIEMMIEAIPGKPESNLNENYLPFIALSFSSIKVLNENEGLITNIPPQITHAIMSNDTPIAFAVQHGKQKKNDPNIMNAYVCYPEMPQLCDQGSVYVFNYLKEAKSSLAWQLMGSLNYAIPLNLLNSEQQLMAEQIWQEYGDDFRDGFSRRGIKF
ncbi:MAG: hypothetical protein IPM38_14450 [Ignavibacteria bacterium]|nr:hypothetical protein [Ignavibacteria bacterium]